MATVTIYWHYFLQFLKASMVYKADFFASVFAGILSSASGLIFVLALIDGKVVPALAGWSRAEVLLIYGFSMVASGLFSMVSRNIYGFSERYIIEGEFDRVLLRPLNSLAQVVFDAFHLEGLGTAIFGAVIVSIFARDAGLRFSPATCLWLVLAAISGAVILMSVFVILAATAFHFEDRIGIAPPFYNLITFARYPAEVYSRRMQFFLSFIVPFAFTSFYPVAVLLGKGEYAWLGWFTPLVALCCALLAGAFWRFGVSRYMSTGS
ncbi:MAG: ABC-2 family transporter protein [bacterium]|nr:ABC-2 family transporter protein [bacterium]